MLTALPFDLRTCAGSDSLDDLPSLANRPRAQARPSRAVVIDSAMVAGVRAGDVDAFREIVRLTYNRLVRFAETIVGSREGAEDIAQEVFAALWDARARWSPMGDPAAYLFASARNRALNALRGQAREQLRAARLYDTISETGDDPLARTMEEETEVLRSRAVARVLVTLTERQRTAYDLRYRRGLTAGAIAEVLGITVKSSEQLVSRVTHLVWDRLRQELNGAG